MNGKNHLMTALAVLTVVGAGGGTAALTACQSTPQRDYRQGEVVELEDDDHGELQLTVWLDGEFRVVDVPDSSSCEVGSTYPGCNGGVTGEFDDEELGDEFESAPRITLPTRTGSSTVTATSTSRKTTTSSRATSTPRSTS